MHFVDCDAKGAENLPVAASTGLNSGDPPPAGIFEIMFGNVLCLRSKAAA